MIAALYVQPGGVYYGLPGVEPWGMPERDARDYAGPWPVVAHPPCARWGRYWYGGPMLHKLGRRLKRGDDGGCFAAAIAAVRKWGGVLEHPEASSAWATFGIAAPPRSGGWIRAGIDDPGWTCCVEQGHYGHRARKATWLYVVGCVPPALRWGRSHAVVRLDQGYHSAEKRRRIQHLGVLRALGVGRMSDRECAATPIPFRDLLVGIVRGIHREP